MNIKGSSILVTSGCGLAGSMAVDLLWRDYSPAGIVIFDTLSRNWLKTRILNHYQEDNQCTYRAAAF